MRRFSIIMLSISVAFCSVISVFASSELPEDFSLTDFSSINIASLGCSYATKIPSLDGEISAKEYDRSFSVDGETGLFVLSDDESKHSLSQKNYISSDNQYFYIGIQLTSESNSNVSAPFEQYAYHEEGLGLVYSFTLMLGMTPGQLPNQRQSLFSNTYYFSVNDLSCSGVSGDRGYLTSDGRYKYTLCISSLASMYFNRGYTDEEGVKWTANEYRKNAFLTLENISSSSVMTMEFRVPVEDVLLSVEQGEREQVRKKIISKSESFCGGFATKLSNAKTGHSIVVGIPLSASCPYGENNESWDSVLMSHYQKEGMVWISRDLLPLPLYFNGIPQKQTKPTTSSVMRTEASTTTQITTTHFPVTTTKKSELDQLIEDLENSLAALSTGTTKTSTTKVKTTTSVPRNSTLKPEVSVPKFTPSTSTTTITTTAPATTTKKTNELAGEGDFGVTTITKNPDEYLKNEVQTTTSKQSDKTSVSTSTKTPAFSTSTIKESKEENTENESATRLVSTTTKAAFSSEFEMGNTTSESIPLQNHSLEHNESIFDSLPDEEDAVSEETELIYDDDEKAKQGDEKQDSLVGQMILMLAGVFLFASVMVFVSVSEKRGKKAADNLEKRDKDGKKGKKHS